MSKRIALGPEPHIKIETVDGDLRLVGWEDAELLAKTGDESNLTIQQDGDMVTVSCRDDLSLNVPQQASLHIQKVDGDMSVRSLTGTLDVDTVKGDVSLREVGQVVIGTVESDFSLRGANGDVIAKSIGGDASLREVNGSLTLNSVSDDLAVRGVGGNLSVNVDEDVVVHLDPRPGQEYSVLAGDDILVVLGDGAAKINLNAGGDLLVSSSMQAAESADEFGSFAGMMFDWGNWGREMGQKWGEFGREMGGRVSKRAQDAAERAARKAEAAGRRMERQMERQFGRHAGPRGARFSWSWDSSQNPATPKADPVSDEERMTILRMLAEKKITSEEAEKLLSALEGGN
jgi:SHOCT-like domain